jgi:uncharacterized protein YcbK (DUF882 family)
MASALHYPKKMGAKVSRDFVSSDFDCPCDHCSTTWIDPRLPGRLDDMADFLNGKLTITSGYRCDYWQAKLKEQGKETAVGRSTHQMGMAADVWCDGRPGEDLAAAAARAGFKAVGVGRTFVHVDLRDDKERRWGYQKE